MIALDKILIPAVQTYSTHLTGDPQRTHLQRHAVSPCGKDTSVP